MEEQDLGPNGAQVAAADMIAMNARELAEVLETFETSYILIDTPGQIELFTFRASGPVLIDAFGREDSALVYLNDPALVKSASGFVSSVLLSATVQFRHGLHFVNVFSKSYLLSEEELELIVKWSLDPFALYEGLFADGATPKTLLDVEFLKSMESIGVYRRVHPVSSEITFGFDEIYNQVQQVFEGARTSRRTEVEKSKESFEEGQQPWFVLADRIENGRRGDSLHLRLQDGMYGLVDRVVIESDQTLLDEVVAGEFFLEPGPPAFLIRAQGLLGGLSRGDGVGRHLPRVFAGETAVQDPPACERI